MYTTSKKKSDESGLSLVEAMVSIAVLSIAALAIGVILTSSFQQINTADGALNTQLYGMTTAVSGNYSTAGIVSVNVNILPYDTTTATNISIPDAVAISKSTATASTMSTISVATAPVTSGSSLTSWWLP
jgi:Tfp pilus assembly protein PilV